MNPISQLMNQIEHQIFDLIHRGYSQNYRIIQLRTKRAKKSDDRLNNPIELEVVIIFDRSLSD